MTQPQPFDPGYDYEADKDIVERLHRDAGISPKLALEATGTIISLRLLIKNMERTINSLNAELNDLRGE